MNPVESLAMDAFARAMECIPFALASNAGAEGLETVLEIRTKSRDEVKREFGINEKGKLRKSKMSFTPLQQLFLASRPL